MIFTTDLLVRNFAVSLDLSTSLGQVHLLALTGTPAYFWTGYSFIFRCQRDVVQEVLVDGGWEPEAWNLHEEIFLWRHLQELLPYSQSARVLQAQNAVF